MGGGPHTKMRLPSAGGGICSFSSCRAGGGVAGGSVVTMAQQQSGAEARKVHAHLSPHTGQPHQFHRITAGVSMHTCTRAPPSHPCRTIPCTQACRQLGVPPAPLRSHSAPAPPHLAHTQAYQHKRSASSKCPSTHLLCDVSGAALPVRALSLVNNVVHLGQAGGSHIAERACSPPLTATQCAGSVGIRTMPAWTTTAGGPITTHAPMSDAP